MRLSKIKLAGFKSFVDPTSLDLISNLTSIVGPNGCGKSNIIDAIRWVMGESSAKNLRGGALTDVIFNGSSTRKPIGQASVELVFDNADGTLGGEYAGFSEIALKRQVTRDGQSTYFVNGQRARRKDITNIFLGTGLGPRSYAIIEQGMISRVLEAKPEDMRHFIEEAAGVSKYKERRRETENRIKHTQDNLNRLNDICLELEKQLDTLEKQSQAAKKYQTLKQEQKLVEVELTAMSWQRLQKENEVSEQAIRELTTDIEKHQAQLTHLRSELEAAREHQADRNDHLNEAQRQFYGIGADITKIEQSLENIAEQVKTLRENQQEEQQSLERAKDSLQQDKLQIGELEQTVIALTPKEEQLAEQIEAYTEQLEEQEGSLESWREQQQHMTQSLNQVTQRAEKEKSTIEHLEKQVQQASQRREKLSSERDAMQQADSSDVLSDFESQLGNYQLEQRQVSESLERKRQEHTTLKQQIQQTKQTLKQQDKARQQLKEELTTIQAIHAVRLGKENKQIGHWAEEKGLSDRKRLAEVLQVAPQWQRAVETLLSDYMDAIYLDKDSIEDLFFDDETQVSGLSLISGDETPFSIADHSILSQINNPNVLSTPIKQLLSQICFVTDLKQGFQILEQHPEMTAITQSGIWLGVGFIKMPVQDNEHPQSLLEMSENIKQLSANLEEAQATCDALTEQLEEQEITETQLSDEVDSTLDNLTAIKQRTMALQSDIKIKLNKIEQSRQRLHQIEEEINELEQNIHKANEGISQSREQLQTHLDNMAELQTQLQQQSGDKQQLEESLRFLKSSLKNSKDEHHQIALQTQAATSERNTRTQNISRLEDQISQSEDRLTRIEKSIQTVAEPEAALRQRLTEALDRRIHAEELLNIARDEMQAGDMRIRDIEFNMQEEQNQIEDLRSKLEKSKLDAQTIRVHLENTQEVITEQSLNIPEILAALSDDAQEIEWKERSLKIERQIARLGAINLAAIEEYDSALERKTYLDQQVDDLNQALSTLENAIRKIDKETKDRFKETFDKINSGFQNLFPRLFGGGESSIVLTGEDLLNTGVSVMARPPGKKNASIQSLSGGEKALTAVAFVFSIFLLNPAPFCILDEVDAPLDDNNVGRFCHLVKEMSDSVQFMFISHNKITISMAEQLHGVTMREAGVSRLVSVDIDEAVQLAG